MVQQCIGNLLYAYALTYFPISFMFNVNRVTLLGNVTRDPEAHASKASGSTISTIGLATNRRYKNTQGEMVTEAEFHRLVCFGSLADFTIQSVTKGAPVYVEGRIHTSEYKTKNGEEKKRQEIIVDRLVLLSNKKPAAAEADVEAKEEVVAA